MRRILPVVGLAICFTAFGCTGVATPTRPSASADVPASLNRVVDDAGGSGDPECLVERPCRLIGQVRITAASSTSVGNYSPFGTKGVQTLGNINDFAFFALLTGTGRFEGAQPSSIFLDVSASVATVTVQMPAPGGRLYLATASATPVFTAIADASCVLTGVRLDTRLVVTLEHLGKTEITDSHCTLVASSASRREDLPADGLPVG